MFFMPEEMSLQERQAACPWLRDLPLAGADMLFASLDFFWRELEILHRQLSGAEQDPSLVDVKQCCDKDIPMQEFQEWCCAKDILIQKVQSRMQKVQSLSMRPQ